MSKTFKIRKGLNISLKGSAEQSFGEEIRSMYYTLRPTDFVGLTPKLALKEGDPVKRGEAVYYDKYRPDIKFVSPVNGTIKSVIRGDKRKLLEIIILADNTDSFISFKNGPEINNADGIKSLLLNSGVWPLIKQRPYGIIANPEDNPRDIFISFFDSAPLAPEYDFILKDKRKEINAALEKLALLTSGKLYLNFSATSKLPELIDKKESYEINFFTGPHPSCLPGVHINKIKPINKGEIIWTVNAADLQLIGNVLINGDYNPERIISIAGSAVKSPRYYKVKSGADLSEFLKSGLKNENCRVISGNVLTGSDITSNPSLGFYDNCVSIIPEGNKFEMFGWALPGFNKYSASPAFASKLIPGKKFDIDTNFHGGHRSYVVTGEYEKVCPVDIFPQLLIKAVMAEDIDKMEQLGIYEVIEEDLALCEFVCTSKTEVQEILRKGLDLVRKEMS